MRAWVYIKTSWRWVGHGLSVQSLWQLLAPAGLAGAAMSTLVHFTTSEPLWFQIFVGCALAVALSIGLAAFAIFRDQRRWQEIKREALKSQPPLKASQLYLLKNPTPYDDSEKAYLIVWSPGEYFTLAFSDYESRSRQWPPEESQEKCLTFHLFNPGPNDLRHVRMQWDFSVDIPSLVRSSGLFDGYIETLNADRIELMNEPVGWIGRPLASRDEMVVPLLKAGETLAVQAPEGVNWAFAIYALAEAKRISATPPPDLGSSLRNAVMAHQRDTIHIEPIIISLAYEEDDATPRTQSFGIVGNLVGRVGTMSAKPDPGTNDHYSPAPGGITAWIDHIEIVKV